MKSRGLPPGVSRYLEQGLANTARALLTAYLPLFSNPKVYRRKVQLEPPFFAFRIPCPFTPEGIKKEVAGRIAYARQAIAKRPAYHTIRFWSSETDKTVDFATCWQGMGFMTEHPSMFLVLGNAERIQIILHTPAQYTQAVTSLLAAGFPGLQCQIDAQDNIMPGLRNHLCELLASRQYAFRDLAPPPPAYRRLQLPQRNATSPFSVVFSALRNIAPPSIGIIRLLFQAATQPWGQLMSELVNYEQSTLALGYAPGDIVQAAMEKATSAPLFAVSTWFAAIAKTRSVGPILQSLGVHYQTLRCGAQPISFLTEKHYTEVIRTRRAFVDALLLPHTYRVGSLFVPAEMQQLLQLPAQDLLANDDYPFQKALPTRRPKNAAERGLKLGYTLYAGVKEPVRQPAKMRCLHTIVTGKTGKGKTYELIGLLVQMARAGMGFAVIDFHNELIRMLLERMPKKRWQDTILFDPTDPQWIPKFNITELPPGQDAGKAADDLAAAVRAQHDRRSWSSGIHMHVESGFETAVRVPRMNLEEMKALYEDSTRGRALLEKALPHLEDNPELMKYWEDVFRKTSRDQLARVMAKITPFLKKKLAGRMFYERENAFDCRRIMDNKQILLVNVPTGILGGHTANVIGSTWTSRIHHAATSRQDTREEDRVEFGLVIDEFQRITTRDIEDSLREARKFRLAITMAYQQRHMIGETIRAALSNCSTLLAFDVGLEDATMLYKEFYGEVPMKALMHKGQRKAICMMDGNIVPIETYPIPNPLKRNYAKDIVENSRRLYYVHRSEAEYYKAIERKRAERQKKQRPRVPTLGRYDTVSE